MQHVSIGDKKIPLLNPRVTPWNVYGDNTNWNKGDNNNVIINKHEWFNSFMPPFFNKKDIEDIFWLKKKIDEGLSIESILNSKYGKSYLDRSYSYFSLNRVEETITELRQRIKNYFYAETKLLRYEDYISTEMQLLAYAFVALNLCQAHIDPVEALVTRKSSAYFDYLKLLFKNKQEQAFLLSKSFSLESIIIPLSVLMENKNLSKKTSIVFEYVTKLLFCNSENLLFSLNKINEKFSCSQYMSLKEAQLIVDKNYQKLKKINGLSFKEKLAFQIQIMCGVITWSKYIPSSIAPLQFRFSSINEIVERLANCKKIKKHLQIKKSFELDSNSGSEKFGIVAFILNRAFKNPHYSQKIYIEVKKMFG